jgi:hypothetical protein
VIELVDWNARGRDQRRRGTMSAVDSPGAISAVLAPRAAQPPGGRFAWLLRNRRPSSCLVA